MNNFIYITENISDIFGFFGGLFLVLGAYLLYKGKAYESIGAYFFADLCWLMISISTGSIFGAICILFGIVFSLIVFYKMNTGLFHKNLKKD